MRRAVWTVAGAAAATLVFIPARLPHPSRLQLAPIIDELRLTDALGWVKENSTLRCILFGWVRAGGGEARSVR